MTGPEKQMKEVLKTQGMQPDQETLKLLNDREKDSLKSCTKNSTEKTSPKWDTATMYACALLAKRQEMQHLARSGQLSLSDIARKAHRFVALNAHGLAVTILMLDGTSEADALANARDMQTMIARDKRNS